MVHQHQLAAPLSAWHLGHFLNITAHRNGFCFRERLVLKSFRSACGAFQPAGRWRFGRKSLDESYASVAPWGRAGLLSRQHLRWLADVAGIAFSSQERALFYRTLEIEMVERLRKSTATLFLPAWVK
jgi:hypothetical protein